MLTLFLAKNTVAFATHLALEETGLAHELAWINAAAGDQHQPDYRAINPKGRVPALETEDGVLTETPALLDYIAETTGQLMPDTAFARARVREMIGYLAATMHVNHAHARRGSRWSDDDSAITSMAAKVPQTMAESCALVEDQLPASGWLAGSYSIADIHLFTVCRWLADDGVDIANYPKLAAHFAAMKARPAVMNVEAQHG